MKVMILIDSNILIQQSFDYQTVLKLSENNIECFVSELIIDETKGVNNRKINEEYRKLEAVKNSHFGKLYFKITDKTIKENLGKDSDKRIDTHISSIFKENIIQLDDKVQLFDSLLIRAKEKKPPFIDSQGNSDKGFKDTLIWMNFLNFIRNNSFDKYIFATHDTGFTKNKEVLSDEVREINDQIIFEIVSFNNKVEILRHFKLEESNEYEDKTKEESPFEPIKKEESISAEDIIEIREIIEEVLYTKIWEYNDLTSYNNFQVGREITTDEVINLCDNLSSNINRLILFENIDLCTIFTNIEIKCESHSKVNMESIHKFVNLYKDIKVTKKHLMEPFIYFLKENINSMIINTITETEEELPF